MVDVMLEYFAIGIGNGLDRMWYRLSEGSDIREGVLRSGNEDYNALSRLLKIHEHTQVSLSFRNGGINHNKKTALKSLVDNHNAGSGNPSVSR